MSRIDIGNNIINPRTVPATVEGFYKATDDTRTQLVCTELEEALEAYEQGALTEQEYKRLKTARKKACHFYTPHAHFKKGYKSREGEPVDSGMAIIDLDGCRNFAQLYEERLKGRERALGINMVNRSVSGTGGHVLFEIPQGMTRQEAQVWMSHEMGDVTYDKAVHELERAIYIPCRKYILYIDEERMFGDKVESVECRVERQSNKLKDESSEPNTVNSQLSFRGIPYSSIISKYWEETGGVPVEGERNVRLYQLAANLRSICDNRKDLLMQVMPRLGLDEGELRSIVDSACKETPKGISKLMLSIIDNGQLIIDNSNEEEGEANSKLYTLNSTLKNSLPIGLKESLTGVPESMHMAVLCGIMPICGAYADGVEVEYCDGNRHHLGLMTIIRGEQASNKSVVKNAVDVWKRQLEEEDALARKREEEWKERKKSRKANEKAPDDPHVLIRMVPVTVSCSTLLKRFKNANGHTIYSFGEELDTLRKTNGAGSWSSKYDIYRLSFDRGEWGQDYNSDAAESGVVNVAYNWTMLGTNGALKKCFRQDNIENGLSSRILIAEMPDSQFAKMPKFGRRSEEDKERIEEAVKRLRSFSGTIDVPRLRNAIEEWVEEKRVEAAKDIDRVKDTYRKRAAVIGFRCGVIFHLLENEEESDAMIEFAKMMAEYCLGQQIKTFGEALENEFVSARNESQRYGANNSIFDQLPPTFSVEDLGALKRGNMPRNSLIKILSRWHRDGWIEKNDQDKWTKRVTQ